VFIYHKCVCLYLSSFLFLCSNKNYLLFLRVGKILRETRGEPIPDVVSGKWDPAHLLHSPPPGGHQAITTMFFFPFFLLSSFFCSSCCSICIQQKANKNF
jgi:hypothetical protein